MKTYSCSCGASYTSGTKYDSHDWGSWTTTKAATCTDAGTQKHTCSRCSTSATQTIAALGHSYSAQSYSWSVDHSDCTVSFKCSRDSSHSATYSASSTSSTTTTSEVLSSTVYSVSGTYSGASYSASYTEFIHSAILKYNANGGSDAPSSQSASAVSSSSSPSGSSAFAVGSAPTYSGKVFGSWNDGSSDHAVGSSVSVPYGSVVMLDAVWEDKIAFTTVPTASCVVTPNIDYSDDGSVVVQSKSFNTLTIGSSSFVGAASSTWKDPNYRDPPSADYVITITDNLSFKSNDPAWSLSWNVNNASGTGDSDDARLLVAYLGGTTPIGIHHNTTCSLDGEQSCLPSWITYEYGLTQENWETGYFTLTIRPALQQVSENTHGDYWIYFKFGDNRGSFLVKFSVDVDWNGGVIVPEKYSTFVLRLDYGMDGGANNKTFRQICSADTTEYRFSVSGQEVARSGYTFKGWSMTSESQTTDIGEEFPLNIGSAAVLRSVDDNGNSVYTCTIYAVWEQVKTPDPVIPDDLRDILNLLQDPAVLALFVLSCFAIAVVVRVRRQGMY